jgi:dolichol-phosphate mannosyltransferase
MNKMNSKISIVSPVYKADEFLEQLVERISLTVEKITSDYEIILIDDKSPDNSWNKINDLCLKNNKVIGIRLSRNFGQHYAITAGLDNANGEWVVVMDCDLQDIPEEILNLYEQTKHGFDIVLARRTDRKDKFSQKFLSYFFYKFLNYLTGIKHDEKVANFGIYHQKVIKSILLMRENVRYFPVMVQWVGFEVGYLDVKHASRDGETSYVLKKRINIALDVILSYSDKPLRIFVKIGMLISFISLIISFYYLVQWTLGYTIVMGYTSLIISIWFLSGVILAALGIIGLYVGKTFQDVKKRPIYLIQEKING